MQSDRNSFCEDVVFNINISNRDEDSIFDHNNQKQISLDLYYEDLKFEKLIKKMHI